MAENFTLYLGRASVDQTEVFEVDWRNYMTPNSRVVGYDIQNTGAKQGWLPTSKCDFCLSVKSVSLAMSRTGTQQWRTLAERLRTVLKSSVSKHWVSDKSSKTLRTMTGIVGLTLPPPGPNAREVHHERTSWWCIPSCVVSLSIVSEGQSGRYCEQQ